MPGKMEAAHAARWVGKSPEQRKAETQKARATFAFNEIRRQVAESRKAQGLPEHVAAERFLDELAAEVLGGGQDAG